MPTFDPHTTALVLIDLQQGIVSRDCAPYPAAQVVAVAKDLAARFREAGAPVMLVHVGFAPGEMPSQRVDRPSLPADGTPPAFSDLVPGLREAGDVVILKRHWGAFTGTDLDLQLRRRNVSTVVVAGIATNFGVESTVRSGWELSYDMVVVEDACTSRTAELHRFPIDHIFPAIARVVTADQVNLREA